MAKMEHSVYFNTAKEAFDNITQSLPQFTSETKFDSQYLEIAVTIPKQNGLLFDIGLYFALDQLFLSASKLWSEWFPISNPKVVNDFTQNVLKIVSGEYRIVEHSIRGTVIKSLLQKLDGNNWQTIYTKSQLHFPFFRNRVVKIIQNRLAP